MVSLDPRQLDPYRLPRHHTPVRYDLELAPALGDASFEGRVRITVDTAASTDVSSSFVLNSIDLDIRACSVDGRTARFSTDTDTERLFIEPDRVIDGGEHVIDIEFSGVLNDQLRGFYRSTYRDDGGVEHVIATTQMQSTDCRRVFPCWDEPDFKAVFGVTLVVDPSDLAISNGPEIDRIERPDGCVAVRFADTMPMSTYLVAFVVGPLDVTEPVLVGDVPVRVVHVPGKAALTGFGLDVATFSLRWFQDYYGIAYPSDKVDLVALPDFAAGAMENLGCITFRENLLLVDPATSTMLDRQLVADVVAHELAHMWFGDLVTMEWWNGIWLNEAFATFMEIAACDAYRPEWERWTSFGLEQSLALETDSLASTRPVEYEVRSPADCEGMFDVLTYQKGGSLLRMLEQYLGTDRFRDGVRHYLTTHAYGNTDTADLWDAIETTSGEPVRRIMDSWIWQPGYPLVSIRLDGDQFVISQRRFSFEADPADTTLWAIPVSVRIGEREERLLLDVDELRIPVSDEVVVVNSGGHGFYRVWYDDQLIARFTEDTLGSLSTLERYHLVDDALNAVIAGLLPADRYLDFLGRFTDESALGVWESIAIGIRTLRRLLSDPAAIAVFRRRVADLVGPTLDRLAEPADGEGDLTAKLRGLLLGLMAVHADDQAAQERARTYDRSWSADPNSVDPELAAVSTMVIAATGDADDYDRILDRALHGATPQVQIRHLNALAEFPDGDLLRRTCELAVSDDVKTQNAPFLLRAAIANRDHGPIAWEFVRRNWTLLNERFPRSTIVRMVESVRLLDRSDQVAESRAFFAERPIEQAQKTLDQILERQRTNAAVRDRESSRLEAALTD